MLRLANIKLNIYEDEAGLKEIILSKLNIKEKDLMNYKIFKKSLDARKRESVSFVYTVDVRVRNEQKVWQGCRQKEVTISPEMGYKYVDPGPEKMTCPPVIVGTGPAGLFAGLILSRMGYRPLLLERGEEVEYRTKKVKKFWENGILDGESNVQFGEGGAGTFSDGKLTTLIRDRRCRKVLEDLVKAGAQEEILYLNKPHIGTDLLKIVVRNIRKEIESNGGEVRFRSKVTDLEIDNGQVKALIVNGTGRISCQAVLLGIGHSARDTFQMLHQRGVVITPKPFSLGVRIEHPQSIINKAQYGDLVGHEKLGAADYKLAYHSKNGRSAYTFCMCPGGYVIAAGSEEGGVVTNGMSECERNGKNANSALLVGVIPVDFGSAHPLAGIQFQRYWENLAYKLAGESYCAPAQLTGDFLAGRPSTHFGQVVPTYKPGLVLSELKYCLPMYVVDVLKEALLYFETKIHGFAMPDGVITGVETRSSSPVRINRNENYEANLRGLYPMGEGAGYAGGIVSSAVDGIKAAEKVASKYSPV